MLYEPKEVANSKYNYLLGEIRGLKKELQEQIDNIRRALTVIDAKINRGNYGS